MSKEYEQYTLNNTFGQYCDLIAMGVDINKLKRYLSEVYRMKHSDLDYWIKGIDNPKYRPE